MITARVVVVRAKGILRSSGDLDEARLLRACERGITALTGASSLREGFGLIFSPADRIGIKVNTIGGKKISTRPEVSLGLARGLRDAGVAETNVVIWDRTNRELKDAGYSLRLGASALKVFGTDTDGAGYEGELVSHGNVGSLFSTIQTNFATASLSLAVLKDHGLAGITAGMKNYFGAIHNPNKYHDNHCDPFVAEVFDTPHIKGKHKLTVLDALAVQYHRGPSFHAKWAERCETLIFGLDPVAADAAGWRLIEKLRAAKGLPSLKEEGREPRYLFTAESMGLGTAAPDRIQLIEEEI